MSIPASLAPFVLDESRLKEESTVLGKGAYGQVVRGTYDGRPVCVKVPWFCLPGIFAKRCQPPADGVPCLRLCLLAIRVDSIREEGMFAVEVSPDVHWVWKRRGWEGGGAACEFV